MFISSRIADSFEANFFSVDQMENYLSEDYVFLLIQKGAIIVHGPESKSVLSKNDVLLLYPGHEYTFQYLSRNQIFMFKCRKSFLDNHIPLGKQIVCDSSKSRKEDYYELIRKLESLGILFSTKDHQYAFISELYSLLDLLQNNFLVTAKEESPLQKADSVDARVKKIQQYIEQHYHLPVFLQTLADEMYLSPQYLSKFFRKHMGITFNKYLNNVRLKHASEELINTEHSITEIAFNNGFSDASAFNRQFRENYQISPTSYRKAHAPEILPDTAIDPSSFESVLEARNNAPVRLDISYSKYESYHPSWKDTINIGSLSNALSAPFHDDLTIAQKTLRFRYVRFNNMFSDEIIQYIPETDEYKLSNLDMIFDFFREIHIIPFIELCYRPPKQSLTFEFFEKKSPEALFAPEKPLDDTLKALDAILHHFIYRYGHVEVSKWRFEVWAKHDEQLNYLETPSEYWDKYMSYHKLIKSILPHCSIGGPGYNTAQQISVFTDLLQEMKHRQIHPDFLSLHMYCYSPTDYDIKRDIHQTDTFKKLSTDPDYHLHMFDTYRQELCKYTVADIPLYITEFNSGVSGLNHLVDSAFQAAFICKNILDLFRKSDCIAYWYFSDMSNDTRLDPQVYANGLGLLEQHGIPKSGFFSYALLAKLKSRLVESGNQYIATTNTRNQYQFLACNYVHYSNNYCFTHQNRLEIANTYDVFEETDNKKLNVNLNDLPLGRYKCLAYTLNRTYGSILDMFIHIINYGKTSPAELNYMLLNMQPEEVEYYRKEAIPRLEISYLDNKTGTLSFELDLEPHEVRLICLERRS